MVIYLSVILTVNQNLQILATRHRTDGFLVATPYPVKEGFDMFDGIGRQMFYGLIPPDHAMMFYDGRYSTLEKQARFVPPVAVLSLVCPAFVTFVRYL